MLIGAGVIVAAAAVAVFVVWLAGRGVIPRNRVAGIRLPDLLASDDAWREGHGAAVGPASVGAIAAALVWVIAAMSRSVSPLVPLLVVAIVAGGLSWAAVAALRASRRVTALPVPQPGVDQEPERRLASTRITHSGGLVPAAVVSWVPGVIVVVYRLLQPELPSTIPSHWNFAGEVDSWVPTIPAFWVCLAVGVLSALVVTAFVVFVGDDIGRFSGSAGLGALTLIAGWFTLTWITAVLAQSDPSTSVFMMFPLALLNGALVFVLATIRRPY